MAASPYVKALDEIQKALTGFLKPLGFKKKGRTYNRQVGDGLVQVVKALPWSAPWSVSILSS